MRILHLEDSPNDAELTEAIIREAWPDCDIRCVERRAEFEAALAAGGFDLILSDYTLPDFDGLWALELALTRDPAQPFIFLSGTIGEERAVAALRRGATDYVIKDRPDRLVPAIRQAIDRVTVDRRRRQAEDRIREQASWLDQARDAICVAALDQCVTYWNAGAERLYGWSAAEAVGRNVLTLLFAGDAAGYEQTLRQLLADHEWRGEVRQTTRAGESIVVDSRWTLMPDEAGRPRQILFINTDVTERRRIEAQLLRAQRLESIGTLAAGIAHDLNNVLAPVLMAAEILRDSVGTDSGRQLLATLEASAQRGAALVRQLLSVARGSEARRTEVDIGAVIDDVDRLLRQTLPATISLQVRHLGEPWPVNADATQLGQVFMNLCVNARDAMPAGGRIEIVTENVVLDEVVARRHPEARPGPYVRIAVIDTGTGIPPGIIARIFDPFFTTTDPGKGTGLGLSTVRGILKGHDGFLEVASEVGHGTTFQIYLPALPAAAAPAPPAPLVPLPRGRGQCVLVIDDDAAVREVLGATLQSFGYGVSLQADGQAGLDEFRRRSAEIELVLTDLAMPGLSGTAVIREIRVIRPETRIILMSGLMEANALRDENVDFARLELLPKPLSVELLLTTIHRALAAS